MVAASGGRAMARTGVADGVAAQPPDEVEVLVVYYSRFGVVRRLAELIAEGARCVPGVATRLMSVDDQPVGEPRAGEYIEEAEMRRAVVLNRLIAADAIVVGAPAYFGSMASPVKRLFEDCAATSPTPQRERSRPWRAYLFRDKVGAAFTSSGTPHGGNEQALHSILRLMMHLGMLIVTPGQREPILQHAAAPYGATAVAGAGGDREPSAQERAVARALGERVARVASWVVLGRLRMAEVEAGSTRRPSAIRRPARRWPVGSSGAAANGAGPWIGSRWRAGHARDAGRRRRQTCFGPGQVALPAESFSVGRPS
jgi:NAD(P)H dehydrogenase (quinone)